MLVKQLRMEFTINATVMYSGVCEFSYEKSVLLLLQNENNKPRFSFFLHALLIKHNRDVLTALSTLNGHQTFVM